MTAKQSAPLGAKGESMDERRDVRGMTDEELIPAAQAGEDWAIDELFERYKNFVRAKARS